MNMKSILIAVVATVALASAQAATAQEALAKSSGCLNCHATDTKKMGPSFKSVAEKYKGKADAEATLVAKLKEGKGHPAVKTSDDDTKALVKWVLAM
jgi:cytochrome c